MTSTAIVATCGSVALGALITWHGAQHAPALVIYFVVVILAAMLPLIDPSRFNTPTAFLEMEFLVAATRLVVALNLAGYVASRLSGLRRLVAVVLVASLVGIVVLVRWSEFTTWAPGPFYRSSALLALGTGGLLLALRLVALRHGLDLPPALRITTLLGVYLILHGLLMGAVTESLKTGAYDSIVASVSGGTWGLWALWSALTVWAGRDWRPPAQP